MHCQMRWLLTIIAFSTACANHAKPSVALYEKGDYAGAAKAADDGLANHPDDDGLWQMRIRSALALGDADGVAKSYATYKQKRGDDDNELLRDMAVATLGQALASPSQRLKIAAINAVQAAEIEALAEAVAQRMGDDDDRVAASAAVAVIRGYPQDAVQTATEMLRSEDPEARRIVIDGIGRKFGEYALIDLHKAANDPDPGVRRAAIRWLAKQKDPEAVELLERNLRHLDEGVRAAAASGLARIGRGDLPAFAHRALADKALAVRLAGIELLVASKRNAELTQIAQSDADPMVAAEAAIAVNRKDLAQTALDKAAASDQWTIRAGAANTAVRVDKSAANALARKLMTDSEVRVRLAAARVMLASGDKAGAQAIFEQALGTDAALSAATDLARMNHERGTQALSDAARDPKATPDQRAAAAAAHGTAHKVTPGLVAALADPNGVVRVEAAAVLVLLAK
jgi:HEAT repeat protein